MRGPRMVFVMPTTSTATITTGDERARAMRIAALARCDLRTALRALREGPDAIRVLTVREGVQRAMREIEGAP